MHVEVNVALNFVISYLYNKLPRRRVDLFGTELEKGLKKKFEGHWYPDQPMKGSGFRCVRISGPEMDPVIIKSACEVGLDLEEFKAYIPNELTLWIDPNEVSYRIGEKGQVKILYSDRNAEDNTESEDREVQATYKGFNPEAQAFNPEAQSFEPIDRLSASLCNLNLSPGGLSPMSPVSSSSWGGSQCTSPCGGAIFPSSLSGELTPQPVFTPKRQGAPLFTTATFAQTKFGSTKLKSNAKRPTRLSPTEFGNFFQQKVVPNNTTPQYPGIITPPRSRSLSPRDPQVEFLIDQKQRFLNNQHQQQLQHQFQQQQQQQMFQQQQLNFQLQQQLHFQQLPHQQQQSRLKLPYGHQFPSPRSPSQHVAGSLHEMFSGPSPLQSPMSSLSSGHSPVSPGQAHLFPLASPQSMPSPPGFHDNKNQQTTLGSPQSISPDNQMTFLDSLGLNNGPYSPANQFHHLLLAS